MNEKRFDRLVLKWQRRKCRICHKRELLVMEGPKEIVVRCQECGKDQQVYPR